MIKKIIINLFILIILSGNSYSAGTSEGGSAKNKTKYEKAVKHIMWAKKYEKKNKIKKANKRYEKALKLLIESNKEKPDKADTLNYLGFTTRKLGDYKNGEKYYLQGLSVDPNHKGINEYLGELYMATNRVNLAKQRLKILEKCNCDEYVELKEIIEGTKKSKY